MVLRRRRSQGVEGSPARKRAARDVARRQMDLIRRLVAVRQAKGLKQEDVAERIGRSQSVVSDFERLGGDPHLSTVYRYADAVGASVDWIVTEVTDSHAPAVGAQVEVAPSPWLAPPSGVGGAVPLAALRFLTGVVQITPGAPTAAGH